MRGEWRLKKQANLKAGDIFLFATDEFDPPLPTAGKMAWLLFNPKTMERLMIRFMKDETFQIVGAASAVRNDNPAPGMKVWVWRWQK